MCIGFDLDNPRRNADCGVRLGEGEVPSPRALSTLSTRSNIRRQMPTDIYVCIMFLAAFAVSAVAANYAATFMFQRTAAFRAVFNCFRGCFLYRFFCGCGCNCRSRKDLTAVFL